MTFFPRCRFGVLVPDGVVIAGSRLEGVLEMTVPEPISRAERIELVFRSHAWAGYGSGKNRSVRRRDLFVVPLRVELPKGGPLQPGTYRYPFTFDVPAWLPPRLAGADCAIEHDVEARLDVDWAIDPVTRSLPEIVMPPAHGQRAPMTMRSPGGFHDSIVLEVSLASSVFGQDEPLSGNIALRSGSDARFDAIELSLSSVATIRMGRGDRRNGAARTIRVPAAALRGGGSVRFVFPPAAELPPTFSNGFIDHDVILKVSVDIPWASDPFFEVPLHVLPAGSTIGGDASAVAVGGQRLRQSASAMAQATGLRLGRHPTLVEGAVGPVLLRVADGPRDGRIGIEVDLDFPDVELGISFRPLGMLDGFRRSPLLPASLADRYLLRVAPEGKTRPKVDEGAVAPFIAALLEGIGGADEVRLADHHLGMHFAMRDDGTQEMIAIASFALARAKAIGDAIARLPFPPELEAARPAWHAAAAEQGAVLVPTGPALHGLSFGARVLGGEVRRIGASIHTVYGDDGPTTRVDVDLREAPLSKEAIAELDGGASERLEPLRAVFPATRAEGRERASLEVPGTIADPRSLFPGLELFLWWVLETRGERRADMPYR